MAGNSGRQAAWMLGGLAAGVATGLAAHLLLDSEQREVVGGWTDGTILPLGRVFLRIIFMVVVPLIFSAIVLGTLELGDPRRLGRVGLKALAATLGLTTAGVLVALILVNTLEPGKSLPAAERERLLANYSAGAQASVERGKSAPGLIATLVQLIPENPLAEAVNAFNGSHQGGGLLAVMVFSLFSGVAMALAPPERIAVLRGAVEGVFEVCMIIIRGALCLAPFGVACIGFAMAFRLGPGIFQTLGAYTGIVVLGLGIQFFVVYGITLRCFANQNPLAFWSKAREALATAFSTASSNATLPVALRVAEGSLAIPPKVSRFVLTIGASANQNGTALYEGITVLFLAQVFGVELNLASQVTVALLCILAGVGTAGVPGGSLPLVAGVLVAIQVPPEAIAIVLGVDRLLDMCRTAVNVGGDLVIAAVVAKEDV